MANYTDTEMLEVVGTAGTYTVQVQGWISAQNSRNFLVQIAGPSRFGQTTITVKEARKHENAMAFASKIIASGEEHCRAIMFAKGSDAAKLIAAIK